MLDDYVLQLCEHANVARSNQEDDIVDAEVVLEQAFACSRVLAVYGTLAPGERNHHLLAECPGIWTRGAVHGRRAERDNPVFTYDPLTATVPVQVLTSAGLPRQWAQLDAFESPSHRRILVPVFAGSRLIQVANLYEAQHPVD